MQQKVTLKLLEFYQLEAELNGISNQQTGEIYLTGLVNEDLKLSVKYWLFDLNKKVAAEKEVVEKFREELIRKYGEEDQNGMIVIPQYTNEVIDEDTKEVISREFHPKFIEYQNELNELLSQEREIECETFKVENLESASSKYTYPLFFEKLVVKNA